MVSKHRMAAWLSFLALAVLLAGGCRPGGEQGSQLGSPDASAHAGVSSNTTAKPMSQSAAAGSLVLKLRADSDEILISEKTFEVVVELLNQGKTDVRVDLQGLTVRERFVGSSPRRLAHWFPVVYSPPGRRTLTLVPGGHWSDRLSFSPGDLGAYTFTATYVIPRDDTSELSKESSTSLEVKLGPVRIVAGQRALTALQQEYDTGDAERRFRAVWLLGLTDDIRAIPILARALDDAAVFDDGEGQPRPVQREAAYAIESVANALDIEFEAHLPPLPKDFRPEVHVPPIRAWVQRQKL